MPTPQPGWYFARFRNVVQYIEIRHTGATGLRVFGLYLQRLGVPLAEWVEENKPVDLYPTSDPQGLMINEAAADMSACELTAKVISSDPSDIFCFTLDIDTPLTDEMAQQASVFIVAFSERTKRKTILMPKKVDLSVVSIDYLKQLRSELDVIIEGETPAASRQEPADQR